MTIETSTDAGPRPVTSRLAESGHAGRYRVAVGIAALVGVGVIVGTLIALDALRGYQVVLNVVGGGATVGAAVLLLRGRGKAPAIAFTWLAAFGVMCEAGDHQARINDTGALAATNTDYFLPVIVWIVMLALFLAAIAVTVLTKRVRGDT